MSFLKKTLFLFVLLFFMSCSKNLFIKTIEKGYNKKIASKNIYVKENDMYRYIKCKNSKSRHFLVLKENKKTKKKSLYLVLKYKNSDWIYMKAIDLISDSTQHIDFMNRKLTTALIQDKAYLFGSVKEYVAFTLTSKEIDSINKMKIMNGWTIQYYSEINGKHFKELIPIQEIKNMKKILDLYYGTKLF